MEWNVESETENDSTSREGHFQVFGREYTYEENPVVFAVGGVVTCAVLTILFTSVAYGTLVIVSSFAGLFAQGILVAVTGLILLVFIGAGKYMVTGDARPFVKIESTDNKTKVSFLEW